MIKEMLIRHYLEIAFGFISTVAIFVHKKISRHKQDHAALKLGMQAMLGDKIFYLNEKYNKQGYLSLEQQNMVDFLYNAYKAVDGNHGIDKLKQQIDELPIK